MNRSSDDFGGLRERIIEEMGVARGRLPLGMTEHCADGREGLTVGNQQAREGVAQVVQANVVELRFLADSAPGLLHVSQHTPGLSGEYDL